MLKTGRFCHVLFMPLNKADFKIRSNMGQSTGRDRRQIGGCQGLGEWRVTATGDRVSLWGDENVLEPEEVVSAQPVDVLHAT